MPNPWASLTGDRVYRHVDVAFFRRDIKGYPGPAPRATKVTATDRGWNKGIGVYDSRTSIFAPAGSEYGFRVTVPPRAYLRFGHAWLVPPPRFRARASSSRCSPRTRAARRRSTRGPSPRRRPTSGSTRRSISALSPAAR